MYRIYAMKLQNSINILRYLCLDARRFSLEPEAKKVTGRYGE